MRAICTTLHAVVYVYMHVRLYVVCLHVQVCACMHIMCACVPVQLHVHGYIRACEPVIAHTEEHAHVCRCQRPSADEVSGLPCLLHWRCSHVTTHVTHVGCEQHQANAAHVEGPLRHLCLFFIPASMCHTLCYPIVSYEHVWLACQLAHEL